MKEEQVKKISSLLEDIIEDKKDQKEISLYEINNALHERGFGLLMILFSFPMAIPLPYPPGFTTILGLPLLFYALQMITGKRNPWLPEWLGNKKVQFEHLVYAIEKFSVFFRFTERFMKPRLTFLSHNKGEIFIGFISLLCSISIILPIWFGNAIPSLGIFIMSIGLIQEDGVVIIAGIITSIIGLFVAAAVLLLGVAAVKSAFLYLTNHFIN